MSSTEQDELVIRPATDADLPQILPVLMASLGWSDDDFLRRFLAWKHDENSFGRSLAWVAESDGEIVGYRTFLRWRFTVDGAPVTAVRAVDTATRPDQQRRGIFSKLTMAAVGQAIDEGVGFVFNTPNDKSGPGYLKLGWERVGQVPIAFRPMRPTAVLRRPGPEQPAERMSEESTAGDRASDVLADPGVEALLASQPVSAGIATDRTVEHLRWRYAFEPLHYRAVTGPDGPAGGVAVLRVRRRGALRHAMITEVLAPDGDARVARQLLRRAARLSGADVGVIVPTTLPTSVVIGAGFVPVRSRGPLLVWRPLISTEQPPLDRWRLSLADVELF